MSVSTTTTQEQFCLQISPTDRQLIARAADLAGQPIDEFVRTEALRSARQVLRDHAVIRLTSQGWEHLAALVESDEPPNEALLRAAERNPDVRPVAAVRSA